MSRSQPGTTFLAKWAPLLLGVPLCVAAGWFELTRAREGRTVAWIYAIEWPMYAVFGTYLWWRVWHPPRERQDANGPADGQSSPAKSSRGVDSGDSAEHAGDDPELQAWQGYLARLQAADPPGGPPADG